MAVGSLNAPAFGKEFSLSSQAEVKHIVGTELDEVLEKIQELEANDFRIIGRTLAIDCKIVTVTKEAGLSDEEKAKLTGRKGITKISGVYYVDMAPKTVVIPKDKNGTLLEY